MSELSQSRSRSAIDTRTLACTAMLCAVAYVVMYLSKNIFAFMAVGGFLKFDLKFDLWQTLVVAGKQIFVVLDFAERCPLAVIRPVSIYIYATFPVCAFPSASIAITSIECRP